MRPKILFRKERKKKQKIKPKINVFFFFGDVSSTGRATCTRTAVDNTDDFSRPNTRVLQSLEQRTHHERVKNERMHETAFDSIAPVLSFVLFSHPSARENARAKVNSHFSSSSSSNVENIIHQGFLFHRARASCLKERERCTRTMRTTLHHYTYRTLTLLLETTFKRTDDCATADWVTENMILCECVF